MNTYSHTPSRIPLTMPSRDRFRKGIVDGFISLTLMSLPGLLALSSYVDGGEPYWLAVLIITAILTLFYGGGYYALKGAYYERKIFAWLISRGYTVHEWQYEDNWYQAMPESMRRRARWYVKYHPELQVILGGRNHLNWVPMRQAQNPELKFRRRHTM
jgi:hypothetical protein